jgi:hypothetical protein
LNRFRPRPQSDPSKPPVAILNFVKPRRSATECGFSLCFRRRPLQYTFFQLWRHIVNRMSGKYLIAYSWQTISTSPVLVAGQADDSVIRAGSASWA